MNRTLKYIGGALLTVGTVLGLGYLLVTIFITWAFDQDIPIVVRLSIVSSTAGLIVLLVCVIWEMLRRSRSMEDNIEEVEF